VKDILKAGGIDVSDLPSTLAEGFWEAFLKKRSPLP
jgi:hypothetical protein